MNNGLRRLGVLGAALAALAACASEEPPPRQPSHVSPAPIAAATVPPGTFDRTRAKDELARAEAANATGAAGPARAAAERAIALWPGDVAAWSELEKACSAQNDTDGMHYAAFFHDKVEFVSTLPPHVAMLGFQNITEQPAEGRSRGESGHYDRRTLDMARRLEAFYNLQDPEVARHDAPPEQDFLERNPYAPTLGAAILGAVGTGVWYATK